MKPIQSLKTITTELTSNICQLHPNREGKPVYKVMYEGQETCPLCETESLTKEFEQKENERIREVIKRRNYRVFENKSVLTDTGLLNALFGNYESTEQEVIDNKERATSAFLKYKNGETFNTWLTGKPGVGKSHLAMSILRNLNELKDKQCLFVSVDEMLSRIRDSFDNKESQYTEHYFIELLSNVDYLVLDDLGAETGGTGTSKKATDFTLRVLYAVANGRQDKSTIITTNLSLASLERMYDPKLVSRLMKNTYLIKFDKATDKRIRNIDF